MARRTHIDHLLDRKAISKRKHAELKAAEVARKAKAEAMATEAACKAFPEWRPQSRPTDR